MFEMPEIKSKDGSKPNLLKMLVQNIYLYYGVAVLVIGGTVGLHTLPNLTALEQTKSQIAQVEQEITTIEQKIQDGEAESINLANNFELYSEKYSPRIDKALPPDENLFPLTRFIEEYALQLEKSGVMTMSAISFGGLENKGEYSKLPIRLSFQANNVNFVRVMQLVANSGSIEEKDFYNGEPIRMMQVDNISVTIPNFDNDGELVMDEDPLYSINLQLSAFSRNESS